MHYGRIVEARFIKRPNRFIAHCLADGEEVIAHVRNTGRCRELLLPGVTVYLEAASNPERKTAYSLIGVMKGQRLINMDSSAPNKVFLEALKTGAVSLPGWGGSVREALMIKPEAVFGNSRFDFYLEEAGKKAFIEVKGVTLEREGAAYFPDAPTQRGIKHLEELMTARSEGYEAYVVFVVQMKGVAFVSPNDSTHPAFGETLRKVSRNGVGVLCWDCQVEPGTLLLADRVPVKLEY